MLAGCLVSFNIVNNIHAIMHPRAHSTAGALSRPLSRLVVTLLPLHPPCAALSRRACVADALLGARRHAAFCAGLRGARAAAAC